MAGIGASRSSDAIRASTLHRVEERQYPVRTAPAGFGATLPSVRVRLLGGFDVEVDGRPSPRRPGACARRASWSSSWRSRPAIACTASRSPSTCGPIARPTLR